MPTTRWILVLLFANSILALPINLPTSSNDDAGANTDNLPTHALNPDETNLPIRYGIIEQFFQKEIESANTEKTQNTDTDNTDNTDNPSTIAEQ